MRRKRLSAVLSAILAVLVLFQSVPAGAEETEGISSGWFDLFSGGIGTADCHTVRFMVDDEEAYTYFVADGETVATLPDAPETPAGPLSAGIRSARFLRRRPRWCPT